jgi:protein-S-isoprenylcysteine O-methyltransferase Ste14
LIVVWPYALVFWGVYAWVLIPEMRIVQRARRSDAARGTQDGGTLRVILVGMPAALGLAFLLAFTADRFAIAGHRVVAFWAGITLLVGGSLLRRHCWRTLGQSFTGAVDVRPGQAVVDRGAYRWVRHPSYTAGLLIFAGIGLALGNWLSLALTLVAGASVYAARVVAEERALVETLGDPYRDYMRRTKRFVPFIF